MNKDTGSAFLLSAILNKFALFQRPLQYSSWERPNVYTVHLFGLVLELSHEGILLLIQMFHEPFAVVLMQ